MKLSYDQMSGKRHKSKSMNAFTVFKPNILGCLGNFITYRHSLLSGIVPYL